MATFLEVVKAHPVAPIVAAAAGLALGGLPGALIGVGAGLVYGAFGGLSGAKNLLTGGGAPAPDPFDPAQFDDSGGSVGQQDMAAAIDADPYAIGQNLSGLGSSAYSDAVDDTQSADDGTDGPSADDGNYDGGGGGGAGGGSSGGGSTADSGSASGPTTVPPATYRPAPPPAQAIRPRVAPAPPPPQARPKLAAPPKQNIPLPPLTSSSQPTNSMLSASGRLDAQWNSTSTADPPGFHEVAGPAPAPRAAAKPPAPRAAPPAQVRHLAPLTPLNPRKR